MTKLSLINLVTSLCLKKVKNYISLFLLFLLFFTHVKGEETKGLEIHSVGYGFICDPADNDTTNIAATTCDPAQVGIMTNTLVNQAGCDSVIITTTSLLPSDTTNIAATTCDAGQVGVNSTTLTNQFGCDSLVITTTTLLPNDTTNIAATTCDMGQVGVNSNILTNQFGCDSVVITTTTLLPNDTTNIAATTCDVGQIGINSNILTNQFGCDSVVITTTTLLPSDTTSIAATTCDPGQVGVNSNTFTNQFGCDSLVITTTTLLPSDTTSIAATTCNPGQVGVVSNTLTNQFGCDSLVITTTTLAPPPIINCPDDIVVGNEPGEFGVNVSFDVTVIDNCPAGPPTVLPASGSFFPVGTTTVNAIAMNQNGIVVNCNFKIEVKFTEVPGSVTICQNEPTIVSIGALGPENSPMIFSIEKMPSKGSLGDFLPGPGPTNEKVEILYTPNPGSSGVDTFDLKVTDPNGASFITPVYVAIVAKNNPPSITCGPDQLLFLPELIQLVSGWATNISPGANDIHQIVTISTENSNPDMFVIPPAIDPITGDLTYTLSPQAFGQSAEVIVTISDGVIADDQSCSFTITVDFPDE